MPWGRRFRLWKFRYKVVRHKKKRSSRPHTEAEDNTHPQHRRVATGRRTTACQTAPSRPAARRGTPTNHGRPGRMGLLIFLLGSLPVQGMGVTPGLPCDGNPPSLRTGKRAWFRGFSDKPVNMVTHGTAEGSSGSKTLSTCLLMPHPHAEQDAPVL